MNACAHDLVTALAESGREWKSYSGRGMSGKSCVATTISSRDELFRLGQDLQDAPMPLIDNLGLEFIVYWPKAKLYESTPSTERSTP